MTGFQDEIHTYRELGVQVYGISTDTFFANSAFADQLALGFPVLSDHPEFAVSQAFGVFNEKNKMAIRSYFLVDTNGIIRWARIAPGPPLENIVILEEIRNALGIE